MSDPGVPPLLEAASLLRGAAQELAGLAPAPGCYGDVPLDELVAGFRDAWLPALDVTAALLERTEHWSAASRGPGRTP